MAMTLIAEAVRAGARQSKACAVLGLTCRTLRRWGAAESLIDRRKGAVRRPCRRTVFTPHAWLAGAPLKTWSWDITFLPTAAVCADRAGAPIDAALHDCSPVGQVY